MVGHRERQSVVKIKARDGVGIAYEVHDYTDPWKRPQVLLLQHGFGRSASYWYNMIPHLARYYKVVCPSLRGLGESDSDFDLQRGLTVENYVSDLVAIIDHLGVKDVHYAGESIGGILGFALSAEFPERIRTLSAIAAPLFIGNDAQKRYRCGFGSWKEALQKLGSYGWAKAANTAIRFSPDTDPDLLEWYAAETGKNKVEVLIAMMEFAVKVDATPYLSRIQAPVLGLYPHSGAIATNEQEMTIKQGIRNLKLVHLPTTYHMVWVQFPVACANHILHFMAAHDGIACHE